MRNATGGRQVLSKRLLDGLGDSFAIMRAGVKPYPCCRYNHGLIDCALALRAKHGLQPNMDKAYAAEAAELPQKAA